MTAIEKFDTLAGEILWDHSFPPPETADKMYELTLENQGRKDREKSQPIQS